MLSVMALVAGFALAKSDDNQDLPATVLPNEVIGLAVIAGLSQVGVLRVISVLVEDECLYIRSA